MEGAQPGHTVEFHGLTGAAHLNGTEGTLVKRITKGPEAGRWEVRCTRDRKKVLAKPENLRLLNVKNKKPAAARSRGRAHIPGDGVDPDPNDWARGLSTEEQYEWLSNCYQMRCDDDYVHGGCNLHGPYDPEATPLSVEVDFVIFCVLAQRRGVLPEDWDWAAFLRVASQNVPYAFEKVDAKKRWGSENVFEAQMGGRSLRYTGNIIYDSPVDTPDDSRVLMEVTSEVEMNRTELEETELGGIEAWKRFREGVASSRRFSG